MTSTGRSNASVRGLLAVVAIIGATFGLGACGGGDSGGEESSAASAPFASEILACLRERGAEAELLDEGFGVEVVAGRAGDGNAIFILTTPDTKSAATAIREIKKEKRDSGLGGVMVISTLNEGSTVVGVVGLEGVNGGIPSDKSEAVAKSCSVRPRI